MCGGGAGGASGPGAGCGTGDKETRQQDKQEAAWGTPWQAREGSCGMGVCGGSSRAAARNGAWEALKGSGLGRTKRSQRGGASPEGLAPLSRRLREAFIRIRPGGYSTAEFPLHC